MRPLFLYFLTVLWTLAALVWRYDQANIPLAILASMHWFGSFLFVMAESVAWFQKEHLQ